MTAHYLYGIIALKGGLGYITLRRKVDLTFMVAIHIPICWVKRVTYKTYERTSGMSGVNSEKTRRVLHSTEKS